MTIRGELLGMTAWAALAWSCLGGTGTFVQLAEGYTASDASPTLEAHHRVFTAAEDYCNSVPEVVELATQGPLVGKVGEPLLLNEFRVEAAGPEGQRVERVPIGVEISERGAESLEGTRFQETDELVFRSPGKVEFLIRTLCQTPPVRTRFALRIEW